MASASGDPPPEGRSPLGPSEVDAAVERIKDRELGLGRDAEAIADLMTAGEGAAIMHQASVQDDLWWRVPKKFVPGSWQGLAEAAAALFDELGLDRYAQIARSNETVGILEAWEEDPVAGHERAMAARAASGVAAPDTDLLTWGQVFGPAESQALEAVERGLERAIVAGELVPGARNAKARSVEVTERVLNAPLDLPPGQTLLTMVITERVDTWISAARDPWLHQHRAEVASRLVGATDPPPGFEAVIEPLRWLVAKAEEGIDLTQSGYLARALVVEGVERFGWWDWPKPPRSESEVHQFGELREQATRLRLVRRKGRTLTATAAGRAALADTDQLWRLTCSTLGGPDEFDHVMAELVALCLLDGPSEDDSLSVTLHPVLGALGWQVDGGELTVGDVQSAVWDRLRWWIAIGVVDHRWSTWDRETRQKTAPYSEWLTDPGRAAVLAYLRTRATGPRDSPYGG